MATYPGGKAGSGVYQTIINLMPPHSVYIEPFVGGGAIIKVKRPGSMANIAIDRDIAAPGLHLQEVSPFTAICGDALDYLPQILTGLSCPPSDALIYCDPPYLIRTRSTPRSVYKFEMTELDHINLLNMLLYLAASGAMVMVSGYDNDLYQGALSGWRTVTYLAMTRGGGQHQETVWCSFPEPWELHDYRYLGKTYRDRERIKRKQARWVKRLETMDSQERAALMQAINQVRTRPLSPKVELLQETNNLVPSL